MITKNWNALLAFYMGLGATDYKNVLKSFTGGNGSGGYPSNLSLTTTSSGGCCMTRLNTGSIDHTQSGVIIGSGTTPPTPNDYKLENRITTTTSSSAIFTSTADDSGVTFTSVFTISNTHSEAITIAELGLYGGASKAGEAYAFLFDRTVLDTPITIEAGGVGQVTYTIRMNYPTA